MLKKRLIVLLIAGLLSLSAAPAFADVLPPTGPEAGCVSGTAVSSDPGPPLDPANNTCSVPDDNVN